MSLVRRATLRFQRLEGEWGFVDFSELNFKKNFKQVATIFGREIYSHFFKKLCRGLCIVDLCVYFKEKNQNF